MFDTAKMDGAADRPAGPSAAVDVSKMDVEQLLALRGQVDAALPATKLTDLNLEKEIVLQYLTIKDMLRGLLNDKDTPANQKAQVANSCESVLDRLMKMQKAMYSTERVKAMEKALIRAVRTLPEAARLQFFEDYERFYVEADEAKPGG